MFNLPADFRNLRLSSMQRRGLVLLSRSYRSRQVYLLIRREASQRHTFVSELCLRHGSQTFFSAPIPGSKSRVAYLRHFRLTAEEAEIIILGTAYVPGVILKLHASCPRTR